jgi:branched-chain amino acid transport system permease protein
MSETVLKESFSVSVRRWITSAGGITILLSVIVAIIAAIDAGPFVLVNAIVTGGMWALLSMGLSLVFGVMNIPNFAHGEFFLAGSLTAYFIFNPMRLYLRDNPSPFLSIVAPFVGIFASIIVGMVLGFLVEKVVFVQLRKRSREQWVMNSFLLTVGLSVIFVNSVQLIWGADFKGIPSYWDVDTINLFNVNLSVDRLAAFGLAAVTMALFWHFMQRTQTGSGPG